MAEEAESVLKNKANVNFQIAAHYLDCSPRHIARLAHFGKLDVVGKGHNRKITTASLLLYKPAENPK